VKCWTAPSSPWQRPSPSGHRAIRRECLIMSSSWAKGHLRRTLTRYFAYYHRARTHLSLDKDAPEGRPSEPPGRA